MLRSRLFKKFNTGGIDDIPKKGISTPYSSVNPTSPQPEEITNEGELTIPTIEDLNAVMQKDFAQPNPDTLGKPFAPKGSYRSSLMPKGTITSEGTSYEPGTFNDASKTLNFLYSSTGTIANEGQPKPEDKPEFPLNDAITLGLFGVDSALGYNQDLKNERKLNESIQQRNSKPLYDYNYMYGRTSSGGTEYQPTIKAEMGAKINKRYSSGGNNNVEIEGGEFIQLPNLETEMASGPSHANGGIPTNLPNQTRVYSNSLKPEGSKKTFAQIAKNYDITSYKKTAENPFAKQVDKDTASIMMQRNQRILDDLFNDQQILNGDSNGEMEAKKGASINNAGFKALPKNVQEKILAEMQYGGYAKREAAYLEMEDGGKKNPQPDITSLPPELRQYVKWDPSFQKTDKSLGVYRLEIPSNLDFDAKSSIAKAAETYGITNLVQSSNARITGAPNVKGFNAGLSPQDFEQKIVRERLGKEEAGKLNELDTRKKAFEILGVDPSSYDVTDAAKLYNDDYFRENVFYPKFQKYLPEKQFRPKKGDDKAFGFEHLDAKPMTPEKPKESEITGGTPPDGTKINDVTPGKTGKYTPGQFPLYQAIPEAMGLAQAQEIYSYAIPEVDAPYIRPQTLNIQSELQNIDNMGTAAMRAGADPNMAYIAGLDAKQKAFQTKQNYDAEGRSKADIINAQMTERAGQFNAGAFDKVYNNLVGQARDAQSAEKQAAVASLVNKKGKFEQDENLKALGIPIVSPSFNWNSTGNPSMPEGMRAAFEMYNYMKEQDAKKAAEKPKAKKGMYKK
jgi:hypothetical protein